MNGGIEVLLMFGVAIKLPFFFSVCDPKLSVRYVYSSCSVCFIQLSKLTSLPAALNIPYDTEMHSRMVEKNWIYPFTVHEQDTTVLSTLAEKVVCAAINTSVSIRRNDLLAKRKHALSAHGVNGGLSYMRVVMCRGDDSFAGRCHISPMPMH